MEAGERSSEACEVRVAGFWRRLAAFLVDVALLGVVGLLLGMVLHDAFMRLGVWGRLLGFAIALLYFGVGDSALAGGQTLGKRLLGVRVCDLRGHALPPARAVARYVIVGVPYFLDGVPVDWSNYGLAVALPVGLIVVGLLSCIAYLLVFNRKTRRSVQDLATGSVVVRSGNGVLPPVPPLWAGHAVVLALLLAASAAGPWLAHREFPFGPLRPLLAMQRGIEAQPGVRFASVMQGEQNFWSSASGWRAGHLITTRVLLAGRPPSFDAVADRAARTVLAAEPNLPADTEVNVIVAYGYDIGISSSWRSRQAARSVAAWRARLGRGM